MSPESADADIQDAKHGPVRVILDTDIGDDIDDTWALAMLLGCAHVDLRLIVTATDSVHDKTRLVAKILERTGRTGIAIGTGVESGKKELAQAAWLGDYELSSYGGKVHEDGIGAAIEEIESCAEETVIIAIGPQTNVAEMLRRSPGIAGKARVVAMGGSVYKGYGCKDGADAEYNIKRDIEAARAVFAAGWGITLAPLDGCGDMILAGERYARVAGSESPRAKAVIENYDAWVGRGRYGAGESSVLFDTVAAYLAFDEKWCRMETVRLSVDDDGKTVVDEGGREVRCQLGWREREAFEELLVRSLCEGA